MQQTQQPSNVSTSQWSCGNSESSVRSNPTMYSCVFIKTVTVICLLRNSKMISAFRLSNNNKIVMMGVDNSCIFRWTNGQYAFSALTLFAE